MSEPNLKRCMCYDDTWVSFDGVTSDTKRIRCAHCIEVERLARETLAELDRLCSVIGDEDCEIVWPLMALPHKSPN